MADEIEKRYELVDGEVVDDLFEIHEWRPEREFATCIRFTIYENWYARASSQDHSALTVALEQVRRVLGGVS